MLDLEKISKKFVLLSIISTVLFSTIGMNYIRKWHTPDYADVRIESVGEYFINYTTQDGTNLTTWKTGKIGTFHEGQVIKMSEIRGRTIRSTFGYTVEVFMVAGLIGSLVCFCISLASLSINLYNKD